MSADPIARALAARACRSTQKSANTQALIRAVRSNGFFPKASSALPPADMPVIALGASGANSTINGAAARTAAVPRSDARLT